MFCFMPAVVFANCTAPETENGKTLTDISISVENSFKTTVPIKLISEKQNIYWVGEAKASLASESFAIILAKECDNKDKCFKIRGFVSSGNIAALPAVLNSTKTELNIPIGTKFEVLKVFDERWFESNTSLNSIMCKSN